MIYAKPGSDLLRRPPFGELLLHKLPQLWSGLPPRCPISPSRQRGLIMSPERPIPSTAPIVPDLPPHRRPVTTQPASNQRIRFTRVLGGAHILWVPMFIWMASRLEQINQSPELAAWLSVLFATNMICMVIDAIDVARYIRGERVPHYTMAAA